MLFIKLNELSGNKFSAGKNKNSGQNTAGKQIMMILLLEKLRQVFIKKTTWKKQYVFTVKEQLLIIPVFISTRGFI
jgi:hypothetical protein